MIAKKLKVTESEHIVEAARLIAEGGVVISAFNGVFGIFCDVSNVIAANRIFDIKKRPAEKGLALICPPEYLDEFVDTQAAAGILLERIKLLYQNVHALGVLLPADKLRCNNFIIKDNSLLNIWTEYHPHQPLRRLISCLRKEGVQALAGTSANRSGRPTHTNPEEVFEEFKNDVPCMLLDDFSHLPLQLRRSTSIVDFTCSPPRLFREGSLKESEIREHLRELDLGDLIVDREVRRVL